MRAIGPSQVLVGRRPAAFPGRVRTITSPSKSRETPAMAASRPFHAASTGGNNARREPKPAQPTSIGTVGRTGRRTSPRTRSTWISETVPTPPGAWAAACRGASARRIARGPNDSRPPRPGPSRRHVDVPDAHARFDAGGGAQRVGREPPVAPDHDLADREVGMAMDAVPDEGPAGEGRGDPEPGGEPAADGDAEPRVPTA